MQTGIRLSGTRVTIYYWPDTNMGLGHIACVVREVKEVDGKEKITAEIYITPGFMSIIGHSQLMDWAISPSDSSKLPRERFLNKEMERYKPPLIQINLPTSGIPFLEFVQKIFSAASDSTSIDDEKPYSALTNNCAHLAAKVLSIIYGENIKLNPKTPMLRPSQVIGAACEYLDQTSHEKNHMQHLQALMQPGSTNEAQLISGPISRISRFDFAKTIMLMELDKIEHIYADFVKQGKTNDYNPSSMSLLAFRKAKEEFVLELKDQKKADNNTMENKFVVLKAIIEVIGKDLIGYELKQEATINDGYEKLMSFLDSKLRFYHISASLFSKYDPQLERLYDFREAIGRVSSFFPDLKQGISEAAMPLTGPEIRK